MYRPEDSQQTPIDLWQCNDPAHNAPTTAQRGAAHFDTGQCLRSSSRQRPTRRRAPPAARRSTGGGRCRRAKTAVLYLQSGTLTNLPRPRSRNATFATSSAFSHIHSGELTVSMPARSWNSVRTNPGQSAMTRTPYRRAESATDSLKFVTHAFDAAYVDPGCTAPNPATDDTLMTAPCPRAVMTGSTAWVSRS